jgi:hypothetical protein
MCYIKSKSDRSLLMEIFNMIKFALTSNTWYIRTLDSYNTITIYLMENSKST